jgi:hypothetical protein
MPDIERSSGYIVLVDQPDDWPETVWIEADTEDQARDRAAEFCCDENEVSPCRPVGPAERVTVTVPHDDEVDEQDPRVGTDVELWKISVA